MAAMETFLESLAERGSGTPSPAATSEAHRLVLVERTTEAIQHLHGRLSEVVELAAHLTGAPLAGITLVGDQLILIPIAYGCDPFVIDRAETPSHWVIAQPDPTLLITDPDAGSTLATRLAYHAAVTPHVLRTYAGAVLCARHGERLGALWVGSSDPLRIDQEDVGRLRVLADLVSDLLSVERTREGMLEASDLATLVDHHHPLAGAAEVVLVALRIIGTDGEFLAPAAVRAAIATANPGRSDLVVSATEDGTVLLVSEQPAITDVQGRLERVVGALGAGVQLLTGTVAAPGPALVDPVLHPELVRRACTELRTVVPQARLIVRRRTASAVPSMQLDAVRAAREITMLVQPIIEVGSMRVRGLECLARWDHPTRGLLTPGGFLAGLTRDSLDHLLDHSITNAIRYAKHLRSAGHEILIGINVPPHNLVDGFAATLSQRCADAKVPAELLAIEVLESEADFPIVGARDEIAALRRLGFRVSIDDFGTGASNVDVLLAGLADSVKVDRVITSQIDTNPSHRLMLETVAEVSDQLGTRLVVEGIERVSQLEVARAIGVSYVQGHLFATAMPFEEAITLLERVYDFTDPEPPPAPRP